MLSNQRLTLKSHIPISFGVWDTFKIFETGLDVVEGSIVFSNKVQLERLVVNIDTDWTCEIVMRWLDNTEIKNEDPSLKRDWDIWANGYITVFASDIFDKDSELPQTIKAPFTFEKEVTFKDAVNFDEWFDITWPVKPFPQVDDETERDNMYPNPTWWEVAIVWGYLQIFNPETQQRETLDVWTPPPQATETAKGIMRIATEEEALAWSNDTVAMTPKKVKELTTTEIEANEASLTDATFMLWEPCTKWDSLFKEVWPTFAKASTEQNIGDVAGNTRVSVPVIWSGKADNNIKLALAKVDDLWKDLTLRIETDNAGEPSGTLIDANATATIARTSLTTSLTDFWVSIDTPQYTEEHLQTLDSVESAIVPHKWLKFTLKKQVWLVSIIKNSSCTATKCYLYDSEYNLIETKDFVWDTATWGYWDLRDWETYYVLAWSGTSTYDSVKQSWATSFPYSWDSLDIEWWFTSNFATDNWGMSYHSNFDPQYNLDTHWFKVKAKEKLYINSIRKYAQVSANTVYVRNSSWIIIASSVFSWDTATFDIWQVVFNKDEEFFIETWNQYWYLWYYTTSRSPSSWTNIEWIGASANWAVGWWTNKWQNISWISTTTIIEENNINNIESITTNENLLINEWQKAHIVLAQEWDEVDPARYFKVGCLANNTTTRPFNVFDWTDWSIADNDKFAYTSSDLFANSLLSKTDATYSYKLPNDIVRFAKTDWAIGEKVKCSYLGIADLFTGLTEWSNYFLQNIPWAIGATAGTNRYKVWDSVDTTKLNIWTDDINTWTTYLWYNSTTERTTTSTSYVKLKESLITKAWTYKISYDANVSWGWVIWTYWLFINWVLYDEYLYSSSTSSRITHTLNISLKELDVVSLWAKTNTQSARVANFKCEYTITKFIGAILLD